MATLVVGGNGNIDELGGRVSVAEGNDGDVDVASLLDSLGVGAGVGDDNQTRLLERASDVVGEASGSEATGNSGSAGMRGELENSALTVRTSRNHTDVGRVVNGSDDTGGQDELLPKLGVRLDRHDSIGIERILPGLANVDDVDAIRASLPDVRLHVHLEVLGAKVTLSRQEHLNVLAGGIENWGQLRGSHGGRLIPLKMATEEYQSSGACRDGGRSGRGRRGGDEGKLDLVRISINFACGCGLGLRHAKTSRQGFGSRAPLGCFGVSRWSGAARDFRSRAEDEKERNRPRPLSMSPRR